MSEPRRITERYRLDKRVSSKDAGNVFRAVDTLSGETVAVKLINVGSSEEHREAFEAHLAALRDVRHPALPRILDFGLTTTGSAFLITEYLAGEDFGELVGAPPARVLSLLLQLADGLEALAARGLAVWNLSADNLRIVNDPRGEQVKFLGLGGMAFRGENGSAHGLPAELCAFAQLAVRALGLPPQDRWEETVTLPLEVAGSLTEPERLRELLDAALHGDPQGQFPTWKEVRQALRTALSGETERQPAAKASRSPAPSASAASPAGTVQISRMGAWEEVRLGQGAPPVPWEADATMAVERLGPAPAPVPDLTTRVVRPEELAPPPAADASRQGPLRIPLKELEEAPAGELLRFPAPVPSSGPASGTEETVPRRGATLPVPAPPQVPQPAPPPPLPPPVPVATGASQAAARPPARKGLRLALLVGVPPTLLLFAVVGLVAWMSRRSAQPEPPQPQVQVARPRPASKPAPALSAANPVHAQIVLAEEFLNASDLAAAKAALAAILPEQIAFFTAEEHDRYQRILDALTPLQGTQWTESLAKGLSTGDLPLLRAAVAAPADAATLTPEQTKDLARARKIVDLDSKLAKAQRAKNHPETLRQAALLLAELPRNAHALQARNQAADALLAEADEHAAQGQLDAALAALESLRKGGRDHPGLAERLERIGAERRAGDQMEEALAAAAQAERADRPLAGLQALERVQPNGRYLQRFQQARDRLQSQFARLDRNPPQIAMTGPSELSYKEEAVTIPLRITDDQGVGSTEAWARPEGGRFTKITLRHVGGSDYALEIPPDLHQRKSLDFYVTATDQSGHSSALGSVQSPQKIKRKGWLSKVLGGKDAG
jgi:hypothetical protein